MAGSRTLETPPLPPAEHPAPARVLIADDHQDSREALRALLEACGYRVGVATNGAEAVEQARELRPHLILMDATIPEVDGLDATRQIRADPALPHMPIVAVTARDDAAETMLQAGCDDFLVKPIDIRSFIVRVPHWLSLCSDGAG